MLLRMYALSSFALILKSHIQKPILWFYQSYNLKKWVRPSVSPSVRVSAIPKINMKKIFKKTERA